ncbi:uncharacterized protein FIESC28_01706 [Fusarium coffeatum]|uniref:BTB domain-containing protein n=1 Tax=Fusarium coffeatum TaxID=231269 RepID=A0A366S974_9HYPO|nr:uncharacterized protein FIESC28_01706 [Fusarium coffeatum]RBR25468.1 hypothetical protein FIESC28_01706 [Fusarium coffeatum]
MSGSSPSSAEESSASPDEIDPTICENGDIILAVGPEKTEIQVTSDFLKNISPVFKAMLEAPMREGDALRNRAPDSPVTIALPEYCPWAMNHLLRIPYGSKIPRLEFRTFYSVAILADKYDMVERLRPYGALWLRFLPGHIEYMEEAWHRLIISYLLDDVYAFYWASKVLCGFTQELIPYCFTCPDRELAFKLCLAVNQLRQCDPATRQFGKVLCLCCFKIARNSFIAPQRGCRLGNPLSDDIMEHGCFNQFSWNI